MKENKKAKKVVALLLCAVLLVVGSVTGTMAYLTSQDTVTNTFTVGNVEITLYEKDTDNDINDSDNVTIGGEVRDKANKYHLLPGARYEKDPTVTVKANSENCWVFVKVENGIKDIENNTIVDQITNNNGWTALDGVENVYYKNYVKNAADVTLKVFDTFTIKTEVENATLATYVDKTIVVTAYAVQADGFDGANDAEKAKAAWDATFGAPVTP